MEEVKFVHWSLPETETREEKAVRRIEKLIDEKLEEIKIQKERQQRLLKAIIKIRDKYFQGNAITKIVVGDFLVITKNGVVIDGKPVEENAEEAIDVERILEKIEKINEVIVI